MPIVPKSHLDKYTDAVDFHNEQGSGIADDNQIGGVELTQVSGISVEDANSLRLGLGFHDGKLEARELAIAEDADIIEVDANSHTISITENGRRVLDAFQSLDTNKDGVLDKNDDGYEFNVEDDNFIRDGKIDLVEFADSFQQAKK